MITKTKKCMGCYKEGIAQGYAQAIEDAAKVAEEFYFLDGDLIADKIKALLSRGSR